MCQGPHKAFYEQEAKLKQTGNGQITEYPPSLEEKWLQYRIALNRWVIHTVEMATE